jgi:predicted GIY-YIG superfamily endonuclease
MGYVYLLHFEQPIAPGRHTTQHYIGYAADLAARIQEHNTGHGARLTQVARERGIRFQVARLWHGDRGLERRLKDRKHAPQLCPICGRGHVVGYAEEIPADEIEDHLLAF